MKRPRFGFLLVTLALSLSSCAHAPAGAQRVQSKSDLQSVQSFYADELGKLYTGMPVQEFKKVFPEAFIAASKGEWEQYQIDHYARYVSNGDVLRQNLLWGFGSPSARQIKQSIWFYFKAKSFYSWSTDPNWPK
jgi:hypothetical protein